jgi:hypothetical protein
MPEYNVLYKEWPVGKVNEWQAKDWQFYASADDEAKEMLKIKFGESDSLGTRYTQEHGYEICGLWEIREVSLK